MTEDVLEREILSRVQVDRRDAMKQWVMEGTFEPPTLLSFSMTSLSTLSIDAMGSNGTGK